jgi:SYP7 family syntaxin
MSDESTSKPRSRDDRELLELLTKLYGIQEDIGAKPKTSIEDRRSKAENSAMMGKGRAAKKAGTRFVELKGMIVDRLKKIHSLIDEEVERSRTMNFSVMGGNNPKDAIQRQANIREEIRQAEDEWKELDALYKNEARKRKSKFTPEQLDVQQTLVQRLYAEIEKVKEKHSAGNVRGNRDDIAAKMNAQALTNLDFDAATDPSAAWTGSAGPSSGGGVEMTQSQAQRLEQIEKRDTEFDNELDRIAEGIDDLNDIAMMQQEEVKKQNVMLSNVGQKIDNAYDHIENVNAKMKDTLNEVRAADKICVDIMCIVLMVGLAAVMYQMVKTQT